MTTPIRPSLAQLLATPAATSGRAAQSATPTQATTPAAAAPKSILAQILSQPSIVPATYHAEDIQRATTPTAAKSDEGQKILRPGSYINIRV